MMDSYVANIAVANKIYPYAERVIHDFSFYKII